MEGHRPLAYLRGRKLAFDLDALGVAEEGQKP